MYELTAIQIEEDARDAADAECEARDAEYAAYLASQADIDQAWWDAISRNS